MGSLYDYFVRRNPRVEYEYERYVKEHLEEHYFNRFKHIRLLIMLNWAYCIKHRNTPFLYWDMPMHLTEKESGNIAPLNPRISVIVASYNYENFIVEALDSIYAQTYRNFEVIVIDDGSSDNSKGVLRNYMRKHSDLRVYTHANGSNKGLPETVLLGLQKAEGDYVAFCEADDRWKNNYLERKIQAINEHPDANIIINNVEPFGEPNLVAAARGVSLEYAQTFEKSVTDVEPMLARERNVIPSFSCCMVKRVELLKCDFLSVPRKSNLDWWLWRQLLYTNRVCAISEKLTEWRRHENSYMSTELFDEFSKINEFKEKMDMMLVEKYPEIDSDIKMMVNMKDRITFIDGRVYCDGVECDYQPFFSVIIPTFNRVDLIAEAIESVLRQTYNNFELIIIDDDSTDGTVECVQERYKDYLNNGTITLIESEKVGVSGARNKGLEAAKGEWIAYLDSDNKWLEEYLQTFVYYILSKPEQKNFYARLMMMSSGSSRGRRFNYDLLLEQNFIDLGTYVHKKDLINELGGFDCEMTRLVDWDLITLQAKVYEPYFIDRVVLLYNDYDSSDRITNSIKLADNMCIYRRKYCEEYPEVSVLITSYNHEKYIEQAIESALMQRGKFRYEILLSDDGSTDKTHSIIEKYRMEYPHLIRDISSNKNRGISQNIKDGIKEVRGAYFAILEGDDFWSSEWKINRQMRFLKDHPECNLVFNRIRIFNDDTEKYTSLSRQSTLPKFITGRNILKTEGQNPIANFSSCMFRSDVAKLFPDVLFEDRFNEIVTCMYLEQIGQIGYIPEFLSVYRIHNNGTWSGLNEIEKIDNAIQIRKRALKVCSSEYTEQMEKIITSLEEKREKLSCDVVSM
jgi:glycosyltransferase involved in cell wall biosynthesis